ncbi:hypothetical protein I4U23_003662 [Adineta vaga]|nr:hypothetical protein I4U23_003662 [Adineta vaga]
MNEYHEVYYKTIYSHIYMHITRHMFRFFILFFLIYISSIYGWSLRKVPIRLNTNETCCEQPKVNINATRANFGRKFFAEIILNDQSYRDINEDNICSLLHFFMQEAILNGQPIQFSKGMFILYDSTKQFFTRFMTAKDAQPYGSEEQLSGYYKRLKHFVMNSLTSILNLIKLARSTPKSFIYVRGDESSHFRERGPKDERKSMYPAYGMDIKHGCMPNGFGHILFGELRSLYDNESDPYYGDRIYIKPEQFGLQKFKDYLGHFRNYLEHTSRRIICKIEKLQSTPICSKDQSFRENTDTDLMNQWNQILATIPNLTDEERETMRLKATTQGIYEIYRQILLLAPDHIQVRNFQKQLENKYGGDVRSRKGNEIIFTTEQLLNSRKSCESKMSSNDQDEIIRCP